MRICRNLLLLLCVCCITACGAKKDVESSAVTPEPEEVFVPLSISLVDIGTVTIVDKTYTLPFEVKELIDDGMRFYESTTPLDEMIEPGQAKWLDVMVGSEMALHSIGIGAVNNTDTAKAARDCTVWSVHLRDHDPEDVIALDTPSDASEIRLGDNISIIESTFGEAIPKSENMYHEYNYLFGSDIPYYLSVSYGKGDSKFCCIAISSTEACRKEMRDYYIKDCVNYEEFY